MRSRLLHLVLFAAFAAPHARAAESPESQTPPEPPARTNWRPSVEDAVAEAVKTRKPVLFYFRAGWCQPCRWMEKGSFGNRKIAAWLEQHFVPVRIDDTACPGPWTKRFEVRVYPSVLFIHPAMNPKDPLETPLHIIVGPRRPQEFVELCEAVRGLAPLFEAREAKPNDLEAAFALGEALARLGQMRRAAPHLERAAELDPRNEAGRRAQAELILAMVPLEENLPNEALKRLDAWMKAYPDAPEMPVALYYKGTVYYGDGRLREARAVFEALRKRFPAHRKAYEADKAIQAIDARLAAEPPSEEAAPPETAKPGKPEPKG